MKKLFAIYVIIGLILTPFIYSNNAIKYRLRSTGERTGLILVEGLFWPSYLFSIEPKVDGKSFGSFESSLIEVVKWRNEKLFATVPDTAQHGNMITDAIGSCAALYFAGNIENAYQMIISGDLKDEEIKKIRLKLMEKMDGKDFSDVISEGQKCKEDLKKNPPSKIKKYNTTTEIAAPMINGNCGEVDEIIKSLGLIPKRIDVHGPDDEDAAAIGCAYRQNPKVGVLVPKGSTIEYRVWFETEGVEDEVE